MQKHFARSALVGAGVGAATVVTHGAVITPQHDSDAALAWLFMYLPLTLGVLAGVWTVLLRPASIEEALAHAGAFTLATAAGYFAIEPLVIEAVGEVMHRSDPTVGSQAILAVIVAAVAFVIPACLAPIGVRLGRRK